MGRRHVRKGEALPAITGRDGCTGGGREGRGDRGHVVVYDAVAHAIIGVNPKLIQVGVLDALLCLLRDR